MLLGTATLRKQFSVQLQPDWYFLEDRLHLAGTFGAQRFPDLFFGLGADTRAGDGEAYTPVGSEAEVNPKWRVRPSLYIGPIVRLQWVELLDLEPGGQLAPGNITGAAGGRTVQLGLTLVWDTRDSTLSPAAGALVRAAFRSAVQALGSYYVFDLLRIDARSYWTLPWAGHLIAVQALAELRRGAPPFYDTGKLGGDNGRGYLEGRFRDRQYFSAQAEYRARLFWRVGGVVFGSVATVADRLDALKLSALKPAAGVGLRVAPLSDVPINLRFDAAYGDDLAFYFNMGEAF